MGDGSPLCAQRPVGDPDAPLTAHLDEDPRCPYCKHFETTGGAPELLVATVQREARTQYTMASFLDGRLGGTGSRKAVNALRAALAERVRRVPRRAVSESARRECRRLHRCLPAEAGRPGRRSAQSPVRCGRGIDEAPRLRGCLPEGLRAGRGRRTRTGGPPPP
ncbi:MULTISPECIES: thioredoxin domain-containing protein [Streptomyces]|uniref:thioredoxin domain-containing protein n=1 Tax=Streptomyces TaxID=1883 RepID=UPI00292CD40F|nr:thioredoxin domain-containing protein [Streptomyces sp. NEAU-HV9]